jgi:hypothetical protein
MMGGPAEQDLAPRADQAVFISLGTRRPTELADVRRQVRRLLTGYPEPIVADAVLVADALAGNAYDHGEPPKTVRLKPVSGGAGLRIEADDGSPFSLPVVRGWSGTTDWGYW